MQEEVTQKTIAFSIKSAKLTIQVLQAAARKFLETQNKGKTKLHHGQQSLKPVSYTHLTVLAIAVTFIICMTCSGLQMIKSIGLMATSIPAYFIFRAMDKKKD